MIQLLPRLALASSMFIMPMVADAQLIGTGTNPNSFPFGTVSGANPGTVYQQVYAASNFAAPGNLLSVQFFRSATAGDFRAATFDLYVSTTTAAVDALNTVNFDANRGSNNVLFGTYVLSGAAPATLTLTGGPFFYNPLAGNLLLDFRLSSIGATPASPAFFRSNNGNAAGAFSRAHNFGTSSEGYGLQTQFNFGPSAVVPEPATFALVGAGMLAVFGLRRRSKQS